MTNQGIIFAQIVSVGRTQQIHNDEHEVAFRNDEHEVHGAAGVLVRFPLFQKTLTYKICSQSFMRKR